MIDILTSELAEKLMKETAGTYERLMNSRMKQIETFIEIMLTVITKPMQYCNEVNGKPDAFVVEAIFFIKIMCKVEFMITTTTLKCHLITGVIHDRFGFNFEIFSNIRF